MCLISGIVNTLIDKVEIYNQGKLLRTYDNFARLYMVASLVSRPGTYFSGAGTGNGDILDTVKPQGAGLFRINKLALKRQTEVAKSGKYTVCNRLWLPCFQTEKLLPTKLQNFQIHLHLNENNFGIRFFFS